MLLSKAFQKRAFSATLASQTQPGVNYRVRNQLFINGNWCDAKSGETFDVINPGTGEVITKVASAGAEDVNDAVAAAKAAGERWGEMPAFARAGIMNKFADKIEQHADELTTLEAEDNGKGYECAMGETIFSAMLMRDMAARAMSISGSSFQRDEFGMFDNMYGYTRKEPVGVCGMITPWNFPILMTAFKVAPMLASGCTGVSKLPELTPLSSLRLIELWHETEGVFPGIWNAVPGIGATAGEALVDHPDVRKIAFTGSTVVGKRVMARAAQTVKRCSLELGGKGPFIVFADADMTKAVRDASEFLCFNSGQMCTASTRFIVEETAYEEFVERLTKEMSKVTMSYWREPGFQRGPIISQNQLDKILNYIDIGKKEGANLTLGGNRIDRPGFYVEPTLFRDVTNDMTIAQEEIFGPVGVAIKFKSGEGNVQEALRIANDSPYGLGGGVYSSDRSKTNMVVRKLQCGLVGSNTYWNLFADTPFGGYKQSGFGRELTSYGLEQYLETKSVIVDNSPPSK